MVAHGEGLYVTPIPFDSPLAAMRQRCEAFLSAYRVRCVGLRAFSEPEPLRIGGSRTPARVVSAHSGLLSNFKRLGLESVVWLFFRREFLQQFFDPIKASL